MIRNILIIEDEIPNAARLKRIISLVKPEAKILDVLESVSESVDWLLKNDCPDLIMMDVRLADGLSFEIFESVKPKCPIIFTTAFDEYAVRAFKVNSIDYLLKPIEQQELENSFRMVEETQQNDTARSIQGLINQFSKKEYRNRFLIPYRDGFKMVLVSEIQHIFSEQRITKARLQNGNEQILPQTLDELEQQLDPRYFFRANRQYIIQVDAIKQIHNYFNGKLKVELLKSADIEIIISRGKAQAFKNWMDF